MFLNHILVGHRVACSPYLRQSHHGHPPGNIVGGAVGEVYVGPYVDFESSRIVKGTVRPSALAAAAANVRVLLPPQRRKTHRLLNLPDLPGFFFALLVGT